MAFRTISALLVVVCLLGAGIDDSADSPKELALALAKKAKRAEKEGQNAQAYLWYAEAAALQPKNQSYRGRMEALQTRATRESMPVKVKPTDSEPTAADAEAVAVADDNAFDSLTAKELSQARELKEVPSLKAKPGTQDFDITGDPRALFDKVAKSFGLEVVYDGDYPRGTPFRFRVTGADYRDAIHELEAATNSFVIPLSGRLFMVAQDTAPKRNDLEQTMAISVPVPQAVTTQELTELAQVLRQATNIEKIAWESNESRIVMRDRVSRVVPAVALLNQLMNFRPEVMIDLEFIQMDESDMLAWGFTVSNSFSAYYLGHILNNALTVPSTVTNLLSFGGGKTLIGITAAQVQAMFNETKSDSGSLYRAQLRSQAGTPATLHVGEKFPVITGGYFGGTTSATQTGTTFAPPPSFTFVDLGLEMKLTPFVNSVDATTLAVETSFQVLNGQAINGIPIIGNRSLKTQITLHNGEWTVIGTLVNRTRSRATNGFWGLAQIPFLGELFKQTTTDKEESNVLVGVRTRLLSLPVDEAVIRALRVGSEIKPFTPL